MGFSLACSVKFLLLFSVSVFVSSIHSHDIQLKVIEAESPVIDVTLKPLAGFTPSLSCGRVKVAGRSRLKLASFASAYRVSLYPSVAIPEKSHAKLQICFHQNFSLGLCQCEKDYWKTVQKGNWSIFMSPYEDRYVDVKFIGETSGSVTVTVDEESQQWRFLCLAFGFILLLLAPVVSSWIPFYYGSSMAIGVLLVIIILLFQGMKLLPTGRKNVFYLTIYGSVLGAGSFLLHYFSVLVNSILVNFGMSEEMHNPVSVFLLLGIILAGAALGYWLVRKFVISEDGSVDVGVAQFVKWAMRIIAVTFIFQSTLDTVLAMAALCSCLLICFSITSFNWQVSDMQLSYPGSGSRWAQSSGRVTSKHSRAEFLSRAGNMGLQGTRYTSPRKSTAWTDSPVKGLFSPSAGRGAQQPVYYSTFHETPNRKRFSKKEWDEFTEESTRQAVAEWASSPEFADWIVDHADRIQVLPEESSDETVESGSDSTDDKIIDSGSRIGLFRWRK